MASEEMISKENGEEAMEECIYIIIIQDETT